jgi:hypothetical protein
VQGRRVSWGADRAPFPTPRSRGVVLRKGAKLFKRILLTAVLGAGLVLSVPFAAEADHRGDRGRDRRDWGVLLPLWGPGAGYSNNAGLYGNGAGLYGNGVGQYSNGAPAVPNWHFRGVDQHPDLWWWPAGYGAARNYYGGGYFPGNRILSDAFGDDYFFAYGYRCNGYRDGYYYGPDGDRLNFSGRPFYRRNADCENYYARHGSWFGLSDCSRFEVEKGYCDDHDRR